MPVAPPFADLSRWSRLLALLAGLLGALLALPAQAMMVTFTRAEAVAADTPRFPEDGTARPVQLPDDWDTSRPREAGPVWYRIRFDAPVLAAAEGEGSLPPLLGLFIDRACGTLEIQLNGHPVATSGHPDQPVTSLCDEPRHVTLSPGLLRAENNHLDIKLGGQPLQRVSSRQRAGTMSPVVIGPESEVADRHRDQRLLHVTLPQAAIGTLVLLGAFVAALGGLRGLQRHLLWFGALCLAWALLSSRAWLGRGPVSNELAEWLISSVVPLVTLCAVQFLLRYAQWRHRVIDAALVAQCLVMPASLLLAGPSRLFTLASSWYFVFALEVLTAMAWYLILTWRFQREDFWPMGAMLVVAAALLGLELAAQQGRVASYSLDLSRFSMPLVLVLVGARLLWQHGRALQAAEAGRDTLESRVREATAEMERSYAQMAEMRVEQVTQQERKRIAADLHDDLGAKLLTIVHTSADDRISTLAREALEEMRLSVRGLTGKPVRLADALGDWRAEVVSRLSQAGVENDWQAPSDELPQRLSARAYVQTTRILREAVSNIIKHSGASHCQVRCRLLEGDFQLVVQDNGRGIPMELDGKLDRGHGMASMKHRAKQLHGQCLVESGPGYGTVIRLTLPL